MAAVWVTGLGMCGYVGVCFFAAAVVNALCTYGGLPVVTDAGLLLSPLNVCEHSIGFICCWPR